MNAKDQHIHNLIGERIWKKDPNAQVILFGSRARGQATSNSDWDILILTNSPNVTREKEYREELFELELEIGEPISTFVFSKNEWESKHSITPFYQNVKNDGILLS